MSRRESLDRALPALAKVLRALWPWLRNERKSMSMAILTLLGGVVLSLAEPWPLKFVIDSVLPAAAGQPTAPLPFGLDPTGFLILLGIGVVVISGLVATCEYYQKVSFAKIGNRMLRDVREHLFLHVQSLSLAYHTKARSGDLVIRATRDVSLLRDVMSTALLPMIASTLVLVGMISIMLLLEWRLTLLAMTVLPLFWWSTSNLGRKIHRAARKQRQREGAMASTASESISAIKVVQALSLEDVFAEGFSGKNRESQKQDMKTAKLSANLGRVVDVLLAIATALVLFQGARFVMGGDLLLGEFVIFLTYLKRSFRPAKDFAKYTGRIAKATAAGERVVAVLERSPDVQDRPDAVEAPALRGDLEFRDVAFGYDADRPILRGIDLTVPHGKTLAILGPSGIGKSTLANLVLRLYDATEGTVLVDGRDVRSYKLRSLRRQVSMVLQDTVLFSGTVRDNIAHGLPDATDEEVAAAARLASADTFIERLPDGYDTVVGERGATLSHGQRQRLAIARAAMRDTPILILDEPTTGLDERTRIQVIEALRELARGRTTLLITHETAMTEAADLIVCLDGGGMAEVGSPAELLARPGRYRDMRAMQSNLPPLSHG
jgi:ATP-binding cassette subfamily B protein